MRQMLFMGLAVGICRFLYAFTGLPLFCFDPFAASTQTRECGTYELGMITIAL